MAWDKITIEHYDFKVIAETGELVVKETEVPKCPFCGKTYGTLAFGYTYCPMCGEKVKEH